MIILRKINWKKSPPIDSLIPSLLVGFLPPVQTSLQMTLRRMSKSHLKSHQNHWTLSRRVVFAWIGRFLIFYSIYGTKVPACVGAYQTHCPQMRTFALQWSLHGVYATGRAQRYYVSPSQINMGGRPKRMSCLPRRFVEEFCLLCEKKMEKVERKRKTDRDLYVVEVVEVDTTRKEEFISRDSVTNTMSGVITIIKGITFPSCAWKKWALSI